MLKKNVFQQVRKMILKDKASFFFGRAIGESLREVSVDLVSTESTEVVSRWFHSEEGTDLYTWIDNQKNIIKQQLNFYGNVVEWNCLEGLKTGVIVETDSGLDKEKPVLMESIKFDSRPMTPAITQAVEILSHLDETEIFKSQLIGNFKDPQSINTLSPNDFLKRFGSSVKKQVEKEASQSLWDLTMKRMHALIKK